MVSDPVIIIAIFIAFALGGILKGATGAGAPIVTIPVMAAFYDVRIAVIIMVIPNLLTNIGQLYQFRKTILPRFFTISFALGGGVGAFLGTILLVNLPIKILTLSVACIVIIYILLKLIVPSWKLNYIKAKKLVFLMGAGGGIGAFLGTILLVSLPIKILTLSVACIVIVYILLKLAVPSWKLNYTKAKKLVFLMGAGGGVLQGSAGLSAPISITFLNSMKLERNQFIPTISVYFGVMSIFQMPTLYYYDFINLENVVISCVSTGILMAFMPLGSWIAKSVTKESFDKLTLILLAFIAIRIIYLNY